MTKLKAFFVLFLFVFLSGCYSHIHKNYPEEEFIFFQQVIKAEVCNELSKKCETAKIDSMASGVIVGHKNKQKTFILTANHFCDEAGMISSFIQPFLRTEIKEKGITATNSKGAQFEATVIAGNSVYDLCLLETKYMGLPAIKLSKNTPKHAEPVLNVAAPGGIWDVQNVLIFNGHYTGYDQKNKATYILAAEPGSSGSPIVNSQGQLVGIITSVKQGGFAISFSPSLQEIKLFLKDAFRP